MATRKKASTRSSTKSTSSKSAGKSARPSATNRKATTTARATTTKKRRSAEGASAKPRLTRRPPEAAELEESNPASRGARKREAAMPKPASIVSKRDGALDSYLITLEPSAKAVVAELRKIVRDAVPKVSETIRWRNLCWEYEGVMCYASSAKKHVTFGFFRGMELEDPDRILEGVKNKTERVVKLKDVNDINPAQLADWVQQAAKLNTSKK